MTSLGKSVLEMYEGKLETAKLPENITEIPDRAFYGCKLLTTVTSPTSFTRIGKEAFRDCEKLTFFTIPEGVTEIGVLAFSESGLTSITFPNSLKEIPQGVCYQCESLTSVTLGNAVTTIGGEVYADTGGAVGGAFSMCKMLTSIGLPNTVRSIGQYTFDQSEKLAKINIPDGIEVLPYHVLAWTAITDLTLPDSVTEIGEGAFKGCASLTKLYIPPSVEKIGAEAFYECKKLDEIGFPVGLKRIEYETCRGAGTVVAKAYIPDSVEYVGRNAFFNFGNSVENTSYDKGLIYWGGSEEKAKALEGDTTYATGYRGYSEIYGYDTNNPRLNSGWHITTTGTQYLSPADNKPIKSKVTTVSGYGDDLYGFDSQGYRYENEAVVYESKLYSFDEYGRGKEITGDTGSATGIVGGDGVWVYLKDGAVQKAKATELFADNVITVNEEKYLLQSNGILGTGYYEDTSEYSASSNEAGITGRYFDEASAKLIWVKKTDSEGGVTYYGKDYTTTLNGIYPNEDGENVKYVSGKCVMLTGLKLTDESDEEISSLTLYCGSDAGQENKPIQGTIRLVTLPEGLTLDPVPAITWSIINNNPKTRGETVIKEVSHTEGQIVISANAAGRAKVRVKAVATVENGASVTYTKDCLVISEGDEPETPVTPDPPAPTPPVVPGDEAAVTGVALNRYEAELYPQETLKLSVVISPANAKDKSVTWKSDNEAVAVVDAAGKVTAIAAGKDSAGNDTEAAAVITVTTNDGKKTASCRVTVLPSEVLTEDTGGKTVEVDEDKPIWVGGLNESYVYTGEAIKPDIHVYKGQKLLREKTDYTVSYKNNKNVTPDGAAQNKQPSVTVKLKGDYTGSQVLYFKITPLTVSEDTVMMSKAKVSLTVKKFDYTGSAIEPEPVVTYKGNSLNKGTDYTVGYKNNTEIGTASVVVSGMGDYAGTKTVNFKITGKYTIPADGVTFKSGVNSEPYTYGGAKPEMTVKVNGRTLKKDVDYKVSYKNNKKLASADGASAPQVIIKGKGNYKTADNAGIIKNFAVVQRDLSNLVLTISDKAYSKKKNAFMKTTLLLSDEDFNDQKLKIGENKDYTAKFVTSDESDTPAAGSTVQVTLTATGKNYTGTAAGGYRIIEAKSDINKAKVKINNGKACAYTGSGIEPGQENAPVLLVTMGSGKNLKTLTLGKDFEVLGYYNNINKGNKAYMVIRGINDYNGVKKVKFKITAKNAKDAFKGVYDKESGGFK
ncbi:MAG: leucine-rich repeat protein [Lachnospiraceae bacterium]|nr:leucine-rich repeat protein [Lachnospiraceae bacterium]